MTARILHLMACVDPASSQDLLVREGNIDCKTVGQFCEHTSGQRAHKCTTGAVPSPMGTPLMVRSSFGLECRRASHQSTDKPSGSHFIFILYTTCCKISRKRLRRACMCAGTLHTAWYMLSMYRVSRTDCSSFTVPSPRMSASMHCVIFIFILLLLLKCVAHPWPLKGGVKPRQGKPSSVIKDKLTTFRE